MDKETIEIRELFCKWCPKDCQKFTAEERLGCLASGGFADELKSLGYVQLNKVLKWLNEPCTEHPITRSDEDGCPRQCIIPHRRECSDCWQRAIVPE